jgi:hypothetical protein
MKLSARIPLALILSLFVHRVGYAQTIQLAVAATNDGQGGYLPKWDAAQKKLLLYRDIKMSAVPAARMYGTDGSEVDVFPVKDLENSWYVDVWDITSIPEGGMVLAVGAGYTPPGAEPADVKSLLLTYDRTGKLERVWEVWPYQFFQITADSSGNIFGRGLKETESSDYPLIVKYSPRGKVLKEFFPLSLLPDGESTFSHGSDHMFIAENNLIVWLGKTEELFRFSLDGQLLNRTNFKPALNSLAAKMNATKMGVYKIASNESGEVIAVLGFLRIDNGIRNGFVQLARLDQKGEIREITPFESAPKTSGFLWGSGGGKNLYLDYDADAKIVKLEER